MKNNRPMICGRLLRSARSAECGCHDCSIKQAANCPCHLHASLLAAPVHGNAKPLLDIPDSQFTSFSGNIAINDDTHTRFHFPSPACGHRSEEHTSELQSLRHLVCR